MKTAAIKPFCIQRPLAVLLATLLPALIACAQAMAVGDTAVIAHGTPQRLYVGMTGGDDADTWIQYRTEEQPVWRPFAQIDGRAISLTHVGGEMVVLMDNGGWQIVWSGGRRSGPPLPGRRRILSLGSDGTHLYAVGRAPADAPTTGPAAPTTTPATQPTHAVGVWTMLPAGWSYVADLPMDLDPQQSAQVQVIVNNNQPMVAVQDGESLRILRLVDPAWQAVGSIELPPGGTFRLIQTDRPLLWTAGSTGPGQVRIIEDDTIHPPLDLSPAGDLSQPVSRTVGGFNNRLHLVFEHDGKLAIQAYGSTGEPAGDLDTLGPPHPPTDPRINELIHLIVLAAMLFVLVTTLRQRKLEPNPAESTKKVQVAPLLPRFFAGLIDVSPFLAAMGWVIAWAQSTPDPAETLVQARAQWPVLLATALYITHTLVGEVVFGRSFGKWCFKLRIASVDGHPPTPTSAAMRNLLRIIDLVVVFPLPLLLVLYTPLRQRIGDIAARTIVIRDLPEGVAPESDDPPDDTGDEATSD